jgi:hypothetical protein
MNIGKSLLGIIMVYMDKRCVRMTHSGRFLHILKKDKTINRSALKGQRLIILHAMSDKGPLYERVKEPPLMTWIGKEILRMEEPKMAER